MQKVFALNPDLNSSVTFVTLRGDIYKNCFM